jgi:hypothetical protein
MSIFPNGKLRVQVAQAFQQDQAVNQFGNAGNAPQPPQEDVKFPKGTLTGGIGGDKVEGTPQMATFKDLGVNEEPKKSDKSNDISEYIREKLESFGYPPRRLEQFEDEFVHEKIFQGGLSEVSIVIPDRYYASRNRLSQDDFQNIVKDIQTKFGLNFIDADRKDKKITMNFNSQPKASESDNEEEFGGDVLDEVYGAPASPTKKKKSEQPKTKEAQTLNEMMKLSKKSLIETLLKNIKE